MRLAIATAGLIAIGAQRASFSPSISSFRLHRSRSMRRAAHNSSTNCTSRTFSPSTSPSRPSGSHPRSTGACSRSIGARISVEPSCGLASAAITKRPRVRRSRHASGSELLDRAAGRRARTAIGGAFRRTGCRQAIRDRSHHRRRRSGVHFEGAGDRARSSLRGGPWVALYDPLLKGGHRTAIYTTRRPRPYSGEVCHRLDHAAARRRPGVPDTGDRSIDRNGVWSGRSWRWRTASSRRRLDDVAERSHAEARSQARGSRAETTSAIDLGGGASASPSTSICMRGSVAVKTGERVRRGQVGRRDWAAQAAPRSDRTCTSMSPTHIRRWERRGCRSCSGVSIRSASFGRSTR